MSSRKRILVTSILFSVGSTICAAAIATTVLYRTAFEGERAKLMEIARGQARLIEAVARHDQKHEQGSHPQGSVEADTLSHIGDAYQDQQGFGETGEFLVAQLEGDQIVFLFPYRHGGGSDPDPVPWESTLAEPMRLALSGQEGTLVGIDYRGEPVLAAHASVEVLKLGVVAKIDLAEVRAPLVQAAFVTCAVVVVLVLVGTGLTLRVTDPSVRQLQQSEERVRLLLDSTAEAIYGLDPQGNCTFCNPACLRMLGYSDEADVLGRNMHDLIHHTRSDGTCYPVVECQIYKAFQESEGTHVDCEVLWRADGSSFNAEYWSYPIRQNGEVVGSVVTFVDITDRERAKERLRWESTVNAVLSELYQVLVCPHSSIEDIANTVLDRANHLTGSTHGYVGSIDPTTHDLIAHAHTRMLEADCPGSGEDRRLRFPRGADGRYPMLWGHALNTLEPFYTNTPQKHPESKGVPEGHISIQRFLSFPVTLGKQLVGQIALANPKRDYTDQDLNAIRRLSEFYALAVQRKRDEEHLRQYRDGLEQRVEERTAQLEAASEEAQAASRSKSEFLANMSHEIRTPMTAILGFCEILLTEGDISKAPPQRIEAIEAMKRNGDYLLSLIDDILDLSKVEAGKMSVEKRACSPVQIIDDVISLMRVRAEPRGLALNTEYIGAVPETIRTDPTRLRQILINLIGNAIKFTESGGVRILTRVVEGDRGEPLIQFDIIDTGIGMTEQQASRLFEPFTQVDTSHTRRFGGTGLGLALSKRLAGILGGGVVVVETQAGVGTRFRATVATGSLDGVPLVEVTGAGAVAGQLKATHGENPTCSPKLECRILLAEDCKDNRRLVSLMLKKGGAEVVTAENGREAVNKVLAVIPEQRAGDRSPGSPGFDLILMDMQMPVMDGYEATATLRARGYTGPIIALTAHAMTGDREKCIEAGCNEYLTKPISSRKLIETIVQHLQPESVAP